MNTAIPSPDPNFESKHRTAMMAFLNGETDQAPSLFAQDPGRWGFLSEMIPGLVLTSAGGGCPFQAEGTLHGLDFYFRYRHGYATLSIGPDASWEPLYRAACAYGDDYSGELDTEEFVALMLRLVPLLERATFRYYFAGHKVDVHKTETGLAFRQSEEMTRYAGWGHHPEDAYRQAMEFTESANLTEHGWTESDQRRWHELRELDPKPLNTDTRMFPPVAPDFRVTRGAGRS